MPNFSLNSISESIQRTEIAIAQLQSDVKKMQESIDRNSQLLGDLIDFQSRNQRGIYYIVFYFNFRKKILTAFFLQAPSTLSVQPAATSFMSTDSENNVALTPAFERRIQKPLQQNSNYKKSSFIEYFITETKSDLKILLSDDMVTRKAKNTTVQTFVMQLNSYTRACVAQLEVELDKAGVAYGSRSWKNVPFVLKDTAYKNLEKMAKRANLDLDSCVDSWAAKKLISTCYHNFARKYKVCSLF